MRREFALAMRVGILALATTSIARAQATRTWVSGVGDDVNPCSRTAPCKTFAGAISKTAAGGEINVLDPGGFGSLTITKSITINGEGTFASILNAGGASGIVLAPPAGNLNIVVVIRNIHINGAGTGFDGVRVLNAKQLILDNVTIMGNTRFAVWVPTGTAAGSVVIKNSRISGNTDGIRTTWGVTTVSNSVISGNSGFGLIAENVGVINADSNVLTENTTAVQAGNGLAGQSGATVRISNNDVYNNLNGFVCAGGVIASDGSNRKGNNSGGTATPCTPNGTITKQ